MTAVSNRDGKSDFFTDNAMAQLEWGAGIVEGNSNVQAQKKKDGKSGGYLYLHSNRQIEPSI